MVGGDGLRVALTQLVSSRSKSENLSKMEKYVGLASSVEADLVVFPEVFMFYFAAGDDLGEKAEKAETLEGPFVGAVASLARRHEIYITFGMHEKVSGSLKTYNTVVTVNGRGEVVDVYRKTHLYDAFGMKESEMCLAHDNRPAVFEVEGFRVGVMVCYEVRFPEMARTLALKGAEILVVPSAWVAGYNKEDIWLSTIKTRAMENTVYVATSNQIGNIYTGITCFVDPLGIITSRANEEETMIVGVASRERLAHARKTLPLLAQRRRETYEL